MIAYDKRTTIAIHEKMPISKKKNELVNNQGRAKHFVQWVQKFNLKHVESFVLYRREKSISKQTKILNPGGENGRKTTMVKTKN